MKFGQWLAGSGLLALAGYLTASEVAGHSTPTWPYWLFGVISVFGGIAMLGSLLRRTRKVRAEPDQATPEPEPEAAAEPPEIAPEPVPQPAEQIPVPRRSPTSAAIARALQAEANTPAYTARWRSARGHEGSAAMRSTERIFDHPAYRSGAATPAAFLISVLIPCRTLGDDQPAPDGMRAQFARFVARPGIGNLIARIREIGDADEWRPSAGRGRIRLESHLGSADLSEFPVASAKLILPDRDVPVSGSEPDRADLFVRINLQPVPAGLPEWRDRLGLALALAGELADFLTRELGVPTRASGYAARPAEACLRIVAREDAQLGIKEVVDITMFPSLLSPYVASEFGGCIVADADGREIPMAAMVLAQGLAERLHVTGYDDALAEMSD